jgi:aminopeptidase N
MQRIGATLLTLVGAAALVNADTYPRQPGVDAVHYVFRLSVDDQADEILGEATVTVRLEPGAGEVALDLTSASGGKGMTVSSVTLDGAPLKYTHAENRVRISLSAAARPSREASFTVAYRGVPAGGLRIIPNIHGERTMFSENWPDNARHWLPMIDHPSDKATGEFVVTAPAHYQVVANGLLIEELDLGNGLRRTHWKQSVPIASWLYAIGVARFAVHHAGVVKGVPLQTWVFPQDRERGYALFERTSRRAMEYFTEQIGPYSYEKLANVQAAGLGGGTEHATVIFYGEKGVASGRAPVVHEVAHQWWGNAVTESDWEDVWLSEGFATYFTLLYTEQFEGHDAFVAGLKSSRTRILDVEGKQPDTPVIHRNLADMRRVLNQLVYQKGGWTLHMLRGLIGTDAFWDGIRAYYRRYQNVNASTGDFRREMEQASGRDLGWFFAQWLTRAGVPRLAGTWRYDAASRQILITIEQTQPGDPYRLPIEVGIVQDPQQRPRIERVQLTERRATFTLPADAPPASIVLDPDTWLLMEDAGFGRTEG